MKSLSFLFLLVLFAGAASAQSFEIYNNDTVNRMDENSQRIGHWVVFNRTKKLPDYAPDQVVEEGDYVSGKKEGIWKQYWNNGKVKSEITYKGNLQMGYAKIYYKNGTVSEEGIWLNGKWEGNYKYYYENGQVSHDWNFVGGKREGVQKYYFENGQINYDGEWKNGAENGVLKEYNEEGQLVAEKAFNDGKMDEAQSKFYTPPPVSKKEDKQENPDTQQQTIITEEKKEQPVGLFTESGYHKLMGPHGVAREGTFDKGHLVDGKIYQYSSAGKLLKTIIYKKGEVSQVIEEKDAK